jgi:hypothetical protein
VALLILQSRDSGRLLPLTLPAQFFFQFNQLPQINERFGDRHRQQA